MNLFTTPPGITSLSEEGNNHNRIGDNVVRNARMQEIAKIEKAIRQLSPLPVSVDSVSAEPPFFNYFTYCDVLGGVLLSAGSVEIAARVVQRNQNDGVVCNEKFNYDRTFDKYALSIENIPFTPKVVLLPGSNMLSLIDQSKLVKLMKDDWYLKPHPVSQETTIINMGRAFGFQRIFNRNISGHQLFLQANEIATTQASEFFILAALMGKRLIDLTKYEFSWLTAYQSFAQLVDLDLTATQSRMHRALMHPNSGWIHPSMSDIEIDQRIANYCKVAMDLRAPFKMVSTQELMGRTNHIREWDGGEPAKQGPRQLSE